MKRIKGVTNDNGAEEHMKLDDDIIGEIISRLPMKIAIQCKILSKKLKGRISDPNFSQLLFQHHKKYSAQLIYSALPLSENFYSISLNPTPITDQGSIELTYHEIELLASSNGLILLDFDYELEEIMVYCIFNPVTGEHQLISHPEATNVIGYTGLAVDYPSKDQYKLVTVRQMVENFNRFYKFHIVSSERLGVWHEIQFRTSTFIGLSYYCAPVYWHNFIYWLRSDSSILGFDTKREEAILIDRPQFMDCFDLNFGKIFKGRDIWLGVAQGLLTLVSIFKKSIVISTCNDARNWIVSNILDNFILSPRNTIIGFPVLIDVKEVLFVVETSVTGYHMYEYDAKINRYRKAQLLDGLFGNRPICCFHPTLASVHKTTSNDVAIDHQAYIQAMMNHIRRFIIEGITIVQDISSSEESSSESEDEEESESEEEESSEEEEEEEEE